MTSLLKSTATELLFFAVTATLFTLQAKRAAGSDSGTCGANLELEKTTDFFYSLGSHCSVIPHRPTATCKSGDLKNSAFVFVKPHANTPAVQKLVREKLLAAGCTILSEADIDGKTIDDQKLIDQHYYAIGKY